MSSRTTTVHGSHACSIDFSTTHSLVRGGNLQSLQSSGDIGAGTDGLDLFVDVENLAIWSDVVGPAKGELALGGDHAVGFRDALVGIAQDRKVDG